MKILFAFLLFPCFVFAQNTLIQFAGDQPEDQLGRGVAISGDGKRVVIGSPFNDAVDTKSGLVRVYQQTGDQWQQVGSDIVGKRFGESLGEIIAISKDGNTLALGVAMSSNTGYLDVYTFSDGDWKLMTTILPTEDPNARWEFVTSVSLSSDGSIMAVGFDRGSSGSRVQAFRKQDATWKKIGKQLDGDEYSDNFGESLELSDDGSVLAIGASGKDAAGVKNAGQVKVFVLQNEEWALLGQPLDGKSPLGYFGHRVCLSSNGTQLAVTASAQDLNPKIGGYACVYRYEEGKWKQVGDRIKPKKNVTFAGQALAFSDDGAVLAFSTPYYSISQPGDVAVYINIFDTWKLHLLFDKEISQDITRSGNNSMGWELCVSGDGKRLLVGYPHHDKNGDICGEAILYELKY